MAGSSIISEIDNLEYLSTMQRIPQDIQREHLKRPWRWLPEDLILQDYAMAKNKRLDGLNCSQLCTKDMVRTLPLLHSIALVSSQSY